MKPELSRLGVSSSQVEHPQHRTPRRHIGLMEFLSRAACNADGGWAVEPVREAHPVEAWRRWRVEAA